jgi:SAM-dependent methyltransferase
MNYGYSPFEYEKKLKLNSEDEMHRYPMQLYHYLACKVRMEGMDILEIGSGRGGGCNYIKRYFNPRKVTGLDVAGNAVSFSKQTHCQKGLYYKQGKENLPLRMTISCCDQCFCHAYGSIPISFRKKRVLCDGGYFSAPTYGPRWHDYPPKKLIKFRPVLIQEEVITDNVVKQFEEEALKMARIQRLIP